jgi:hypothetical protein
MSTFVLMADTAHGVQKIGMSEFLADNPGQAFVSARDFIDFLEGMEDGELVAALFDPMVHADYYAEIASCYSIENAAPSVMLHGKAIDFAAATVLMDDEIRETLHSKKAWSTEQDFLDAYTAAHAAMFGGEEFNI